MSTSAQIIPKPLRIAVLAPAAVGFAFLLVTQCTPAMLDGPAHSLVALALTAGIFAIVTMPGLALACLASESIAAELRAGLVVIGSAAAAWLYFWSWYVSAGLGLVLIYALPIASSFVVAHRRARLADIRVPVGACLAVLLAYVIVAGDQGNLVAGNHMIRERYWTGLDNELPRLVIDRLLFGEMHGLLIGDWHISDRGPLISGIALTVYPITRAGLASFGYLASTAVANAFWVIGLWSFLIAAGVKRERISVLLVIAAATGANFVNTVYTWPKLFAGALVLLVAAAILSRDVRPALRALIIGAGSAFAFVAHGSSAFGLIGLVPILWMTRRDWRWSHAITAALLAVAIYLPWSAYQRFVDPPGDRLIKWHLAGVIPPDESVGAAQAIVQSYREAGLEGSIVNKLYNVRTVLGDWSLYEGQIRGANPQLGWSSSFVGLLRQATTARLGPSAGLMLLGLLAFAVKRVRSASWSAPTMQIIAASTLAYVLLEWGGNWYSAAWLHTTPASLSVLWAIAGALALAELGEGWLTLAALVQLGAFGIVWARGIFSNAAVPGVVPLDTADVEMNAIKAGVFLAAVAFVVYRAVKGWRARGKIARR